MKGTKGEKQGTKDIEDRKTIMEHPEIYRVLYENAMDGILLTGPDGKIYSANEAACRMMKLSESEICRLGRSGIVDQSDPSLPDAFKKRKENGKFFGELSMIKGDGTRFTVEVSSSVFADSEGNSRTSMVIRDISERKQIENSLRKSEKQYHELIDTIQDGIVVHCEGRIEFGNPAGARIIGAPNIESLIGKPVIDFVHPDFREIAFIRIKNSLTNNVAAPTYEEKFICLDGKVIDVEVNASPVSFNNKPAMLTIFRDITKTKLVEEERKKNRELNNSILQTAMDGYWLIRNDGTIEEINESLCKMTGYSRKDLLSMHISDVDALESNQDAADHMKKIKKEGFDFFESQLLRKDGTYIDVEVSAQYRPELDDKILAFFHDITSRKTSESELRQNQLNLEQKVTELESFNDLMLNRELKMVELKNEINKLHMRLGEEPVYKIVR